MKLALVSPTFSPRVGGVERHVEALAVGLVRQGASVEVLTTGHALRRQRAEPRDGYLVRCFPAVGPEDAYHLSPALGTWLSRFVDRYDLVHAHNYHALPGPLAAVACLAHRVPYVLTPHYHGVSASTMGRAMHVPYRLIAGPVVRRAAAVICVSKAEAELVDRDFGRRGGIRVIPNGVDTRVPPDVPREKGLLLAVGRLEPYKQVELVVRSLALLPVTYRLVVVGDGPRRDELERLVSRLRLESRVRLLGQVSADDLNTWYRRSELLVSMSRHESFGLVALEAAAAGARVIASDIPAHLEIQGYCRERIVHLCPRDAGPDLLAALIRAVTDSAEPLLVTAFHFPTWDEMARAVASVYAEVLETKNES